MNNELKKKTSEWMQLERKTIEQRKIAEAFYENELMKPIENDFIRRNKEQLGEKVEYLVMSVGTSYEPIVLNIRLFKPKKILFLYTETTGFTIDKVVKYCGLEPSEYSKCIVSETNPLDIYREIKRIYLSWSKPDKMYIDFTGGTKAMSAAAAMAAAMINVQLVYVGTNDYLVDFRKPNPGSETLYFITNPLAVFGDLEIEKAMALFAKYNYAGVVDKLQVLKETIPDPDIRQQLNFVYLLAKSYEAWDSLDFIPAYNYLSELNRQLKRDKMVHSSFLLMDYISTFQRQEEILSYLKTIPELISKKENIQILKNKDTIFALMFTMCQNGIIREAQGKYDMATLLFYRLLEMIEQESLAKYNLFVSQMNYEEIEYDYEKCPEMKGKSSKDQKAILKAKVFSIREKIFNKGNDFLSEQVSLLDGFILLYALGNPISDKGNERDSIIFLKKIRSMVFLRNNSIFAHGLGPVNEADFHKFMTFVIDVFSELCVIDKVNFAEYAKNMTWINPVDSKFYTSNMEE